MTPSITVHEFPAVLEMQPSPFGLKLETWLRMAGFGYEMKSSVQDLGPKGKVPFATIDGDLMGDSELIIEHISRKTGQRLEDNLNEQQQAQGVLMRRLIEEHLYFILVYSRWVDPDGWSAMCPLFFAPAPAFLRGFISRKVRKQVIANLRGQGIARHTQEEVYEKAKEDLATLSVLLGEKAYFLGDTPTVADASAYGLLANIYYQPQKGPLQSLLAEHNNLVRYCQQIKVAYWPNSMRGGGDEPVFVPQEASGGA